MSLKAKKVLITAGPTWVAIDQVRVISNLATGETGWLLAQSFKKSGFPVTLLLGPAAQDKKIPGVRLLRFKYFEELERILEQELKKGDYAALVHAAAVADYRPQKAIRGKVSSAKNSWTLKLVPTRKLILGIKKKYPGIKAAGFKFQPQASGKKLVDQGWKLLKAADLDLVVANSNQNGAYQAYVLDGKNVRGPFLSKHKMAAALPALLKS